MENKRNSTIKSNFNLPYYKISSKTFLKVTWNTPDSVFSLKISFHSILSTLSPRKINYKKYDVYLFKTNQQGKWAFAEHSTTRRLSFLLPSFLTPSWSSYYNFTWSNTRSLYYSTCHPLSFILHISTCVNLYQHFWRLGHSSLKRLMTGQMELFLAIVMPSLFPPFCRFRI